MIDHITILPMPKTTFDRFWQAAIPCQRRYTDNTPEIYIEIETGDGIIGYVFRCDSGIAEHIPWPGGVLGEDPRLAKKVD